MKIMLLLSLLLLLDSAAAVLVNSTYDDSSPVIVYKPFDAHWFSNPAYICPQCPTLNMAIDSTYHYGSHFVPEDADDVPANTTVTAKPKVSDAGSHDDANGQPDRFEHDDGDTGGNVGGNGRGRGDGRKRSLWRRDDLDDPGFVDTPVNATLTFNETGIGVYVYCIVPVQNDNNASNPLLSNMTFTLDGVLVNSFVHRPPSGPSPQYNFSQLVFASSGLMNGQHTIMISPQLGSMIMLDAIDIASDSSDISNQNSTNTGLPTTKSSSKDIETFAIAIGSTTGVLAILSFIVAASIYIRRRRSAKREKLREAREESLRPEMRGLQPFIPRYFPGTIIVSQTSNLATSVNASVSRRSSRSSMSPSHGLNYPLAPDVPSYSSVIPSVAEIRSPLPISIALRASIVRLPEDDDIVPPSYQEVGQTALLFPPAFDQPAPSFSELSPTRHSLILSSHEENALEDDPGSSTTSAALLSSIPLILDED